MSDDSGSDRGVSTSKWRRTVPIQLWAWTLFWGLSLFSGNVISVLLAGFLLAAPFIWPSFTDPPRVKGGGNHGEETGS